MSQLFRLEIGSHISDGNAAAERVGGEREERENADSKGRPVGREGRMEIRNRQKYQSLAIFLGSFRQCLVSVAAATVFTSVSVYIL